MPLTHSEVNALPAKKNPYFQTDDNRTRGEGRLGVQVYPSGTKTLTFRYRRDGKWAFIPLGSFPTLTLADAREKAKAFGQMIRDGLDPKDELANQAREREQEKREHEQQGTIEQLFRSYTEQMMHIPVENEHLFRFKMNADSGLRVHHFRTPQSTNSDVR
ncbi:Arm DNA-binding domain-containing protein [Aeromonas caviae]|uniref:Arm DNA-binding domain-containing protein n=1 Tax=Aeromonas caviae TaxID=648 RepID=UPI000FEB7585|nr:Arm DNA-binding domain-containing protein [Aeromonas caviae]RWT36825.1 hypothetical protein DN613_13155 [Aeromonas caviae]